MGESWGGIPPNNNWKIVTCHPTNEWSSKINSQIVVEDGQLILNEHDPAFDTHNSLSMEIMEIVGGL